MGLNQYNFPILHWNRLCPCELRTFLKVYIGKIWTKLKSSESDNIGINPTKLQYFKKNAKKRSIITENKVQFERGKKVSNICTTENCFVFFKWKHFYSTKPQVYKGLKARYPLRCTFLILHSISQSYFFARPLGFWSVWENFFVPYVSDLSAADKSS